MQTLDISKHKHTHSFIHERHTRRSSGYVVLLEIYGNMREMLTVSIQRIAKDHRISKQTNCMNSSSRYIKCLDRKCYTKRKNRLKYRSELDFPFVVLLIFSARRRLDLIYLKFCKHFTIYYIWLKKYFIVHI